MAETKKRKENPVTERSFVIRGSRKKGQKKLDMMRDKKDHYIRLCSNQTGDMGYYHKGREDAIFSIQYSQVRDRITVSVKRVDGNKNEDIRVELAIGLAAGIIVYLLLQLAAHLVTEICIAVGVIVAIITFFFGKRAYKAEFRSFDKLLERYMKEYLQAVPEK